MRPLFISTDLDRTLLPNGEQPESLGARSMFSRFVARPEVTLAYVSGRHLSLVEASIQSYALPTPEWIVADVGTSIYQRTDSGWSPLDAWSRHIAPDWHGCSAADLVPMFADLPDLSLQPRDRQNTYKLSYHVSLDADIASLMQAMNAILAKGSFAASLIHSVDEQAEMGLLDVLPRRATKLHAVEFLMQMLGFELDETVFAGDSGNDLPVLTSSVPAVLVANASAGVVREATAEAQRKGTAHRLYLARGNFLGMNGNYSAGILEGIAHFHPDTKKSMG